MSERDPGWPGFVLTIALSAAVAAAAIWSHRPRLPQTEPGPGEFSVTRARQVLSRLVGDGTPHATGTPANAAVRERVIAEFVRMGYAPTTHEAFICGGAGACATVVNVLARLPGTSGSKAVMLSAHYDSVAAGPGASDDGMGVAVLLEAARLLRGDGPHRNPVLFLIDDGEEPGLLGAEAFTRDHPWARDVGVVVNLDSRGTTGPSFLFETSDDNRWLIELAAAALPRPDTSSLFYTIYKWLPNDTDLTIFRRAGLSGVNFANIGDVERYHTPLDTFASASPATLYEHGVHVLAMARALAEANLAAPHLGNAVFFDVFGMGILRWPQERTLPYAAAAALLLAAAIAAALRRGPLTAAEFARGLAAGGLALVVPVGAAAAAVALLRAGGAIPTAWVAHPLPILAAVWTLAGAGAWLVAGLASRWCGWRGLWAGSWALTAAAALLLSRTEPGPAFLPLVSCVVAGAAGLAGLASRSPAVGALAVALPAAAAGFFWLPIAWLLYGALGARSVAIGAAVGAWAAAAAPAFPLLPARARWRLLAGLSAAGLVAIAAALLCAPHDASVPQRMEIVYQQDANASARWLVFPESGQLPPRLRGAGFVAAANAQPWTGRYRGFTAAAERRDLAPPRLVLRESARTESGRRLRVTLVSDRLAPIVFLALPSSARPSSPTIAGQPVRVNPRVAAQRRGWTLLSCLTTPPEGVDFAFTLPDDPAIEILAGDRSYGLPSGSERVLSLRGDSAVTSQSGDVSEVIVRVRF
ncbi:MAG TPA: M28 family peptidase [Thermoanaerobaculia bacterium]|nr:M28 family peptidase [Thermoanaerobaculia bacterium]